MARRRYRIEDEDARRYRVVAETDYAVVFRGVSTFNHPIKNFRSDASGLAHRLDQRQTLGVDTRGFRPVLRD